MRLDDLLHGMGSQVRPVNVSIMCMNINEAAGGHMGTSGRRQPNRSANCAVVDPDSLKIIVFTHSL